MDSDTPMPEKRPARPLRHARHMVKLELPREFVALCERAQVEPAQVLKGFIADLCDIVPWNGRSLYARHSETASRAARAYYAVVSGAVVNDAGAGGGGQAGDGEA